MAAVICILILEGASAINIHFSASSGGQTVGVVDSYNIDDSVGASGKASASFEDGLSIDESNSLWGSGSANINQEFYGSGGGADYTLYRALNTLEASKIAGSGSSSLTPAAGEASSYLSTTGSLETTSELWGAQGGDIAGVGSRALLAEISTSQSVATGGSVAASQKVDAHGVHAVAYGEGMDSEESYVLIYATVSDGTLDASQGVKAGNSAAGRQSTVIEGRFAYAYCEAYNPNEDYYAYVDNWINGNAYLEFFGEATVDGDEARAHQRSYAEGDFIWPWARSTYKLEERIWAGAYSSESWAWTNENTHDAVIDP